MRQIISLPQHHAGFSVSKIRTGYAVHLEVGDDHDVTIETPFQVVDGSSHSAPAQAVVSTRRREIGAEGNARSCRVGRPG